MRPAATGRNVSPRGRQAEACTPSGCYFFGSVPLSGFDSSFG